MTELERDAGLTRRYRELPGEEPPRALDEAIRAAARRAAESRPAPLVAPSGRRRYVPLAAAAVIVLSVIVSLRMQQELPDPESGALAPRALPPAAPVAGERPAGEGRPLSAHPGAAQRDAVTGVETPKAEVARRLEAASAPRSAVQSPRVQPAPAAAPPEAPRLPEAFGTRGAGAPAPAGRQEKPASPPRADAPEAASPGAARLAEDEPAASVGRAAPRPSEERAASVAKQESPEAWLEHIARLRAAGRHEEADRSLAEFRRRYPDYVIRKEMLERLERAR
jgi:hypothetical protein